MLSEVIDALNRRGYEVPRAAEMPKDVDIKSLRREALAGRELMKEMK
jgi:hypothetical protein